MYKEREYRSWVQSGDLVKFEVKESQTDLLILAEKDLEKQARASVLNLRKEIEEYIIAQPDTVKYLGESKIKKVIIVPGKIINIVS